MTTPTEVQKKPDFRHTFQAPQRHDFSVSQGTDTIYFITTGEGVYLLKDNPYSSGRPKNIEDISCHHMDAVAALKALTFAALSHSQTYLSVEGKKVLRDVSTALTQIYAEEFSQPTTPKAKITVKEPALAPI